MAIGRAVVQVTVARLTVVQVMVVQVPVGRRGSVRTVVERVLRVVGAMIGARAVTIVDGRRARANVLAATRVSHHAA